MIRKIIKIGGIITSLVVTILLFVFGEGLLVGAIYLLGPILSFFIFSIIFTLLSFSIIYIYFKQEKSGNRIIRKVEKWIENKEVNLNKMKLKLLKYGKFFAIVSLGVTAGPLPTSIFIGVLGYSKQHTYLITALINILFFVIWISIYSGGIELIKGIFK